VEYPDGGAGARGDDRRVPHVRRIHKDISATAAAPNLADYERARETFSWAAAREALDGLPEGRGLNIAHEAVDRHVAAGRGDACAIRWRGRKGASRDLSYAELAAESSRFAGLLDELGVEPGERVFACCGRVPELYVAVLGTLKAGAVFCPLFSAFGPEPLRQRLSLGTAKVLLTTSAIYTRRIAPLRDTLPHLEHVLFIEELAPLLAAQPDDWEIPPTDPESPALLHFTSGTTGTPKGAVHVHEAVVAHHATGAMALDLHPDDVFWCTADPGWVTGTSYGIISPLTHGVTLVVDEAEFDARRWYGMLERERVSVWYTAPTAVRMLMRAGVDLAREHDLGGLRFIASVGEPLNAEAVVWADEVLGLPIHDNWWQTETGGIMVANYASMDIKPGSMGRPLPGVDATVLERDREGHIRLVDGQPVEVSEPGAEGELALRAGWPSMFRGYLNDPERYEHCFAGGWYLTGDLVRRDAEGYFWFVGRGDDVIKTSGHLIGPFEVESVLLEHPAVAEAGVIGVPDPVAGELVKAFVLLAPGVPASDALRRELVAHARRRLGAAVAPREIDFSESLPHTRSGKIMRRLLRARELGLEQGDLSTLEPVR
jgi:acetyl-CoA synthetase